MQYNTDGKFYKAIKNYYNCTESCVKLNNLMSEWFQVNCGVRQGDPLSPTLLSLYISELAKEIKNMKLGIKFSRQLFSMLLYADDIVLLSNKETDLQLMLNKVSTWCKLWRLKVNEGKTKILHFNRGNTKQRSSFTFMYNGVQLNIVPDYKYIYIIYYYG